MEAGTRRLRSWRPGGSWWIWRGQKFSLHLLIVLIVPLIWMGKGHSKSQRAAISQDERATPALGVIKSSKVEASLVVLGGKLLVEVSRSGSTAPLAELREELPLRAEIFLGDETSELVSMGSGELQIRPGQSLRLVILAAGPTGEPLPVFAQRGRPSRIILHEGRRLLLYRQAPLSEREGEAPEGTLRLAAEELAIGNREVKSSPLPALVRIDPSAPALLPDRVAIQLRLLGPELTDEAGRLSIELATTDLAGEAIFEVEWQAQVSRHRLRLAALTHLLLPLRLPRETSIGEDPLSPTETIRYRLTGRSGEELLSGEVSLATLLEEEEARRAEVGPLLFDRSLYLPGDHLEVLVPIQGRVEQGYRLLIMARGGDGALFHHVELEVLEAAPRLTLPLPITLRAPAVLEYQLRDRRSGFLYSQGSQPIPLAP
jgi:hypothetical protein